MKYIKYLLLLVTLLSVRAAASDWRTYLSYNEASYMVPAGKYIYVVANNGLYSYNRNDHSVRVYSKTDLLSDVQVNFIGWSKTVKKLAIIYKNGNIDLLGNDGDEIENISDYYTKSVLDDKTINSIFIEDNLLLFATNFGVVKIDMKKGEIMESYRLNAKIQKVDIVDNKILALDEKNILFTGDMNSNLLDYSMWSRKQNDYDFPDKTEKLSDEERQAINTLTIDGPKNNQISKLKFTNGRLIVAAGGRMSAVEGYYNYTATLQELKDGEWKYYDKITPLTPLEYDREITDIEVDPKDENHVFVSTFGNGLYEFQNGHQLKNYTITNTDCINSVIDNNFKYVRTGGVCYYPPTHDLYFLNFETSTALLKLSDDGKVEHLYHSELFGKYANYTTAKSWANMVGTILDSRNLMWFVNDNHNTPALYAYEAKSDNITRFNTFINQDGTTISDLNYVRCVAEDFDHNIWIGTDQGPLLLTSELMQDSKAGFIQVKVPRNDGTNYADYLLSGVDITCIKVDPAGRKWMGTNGSGVYLISEDNMEQVEHFTTENSGLLENNIRDIAIDNRTGEVFFATNNGLCSYIGAATEAFAELNKDNVWAYPNPVTPEYNGEITIVGLSLNASVTITTSSGHIVASGKSTGGSFKWDGCDKSGNRVASGVYMVHTATAEGKSGIVTKVAVIR